MDSRPMLSVRLRRTLIGLAVVFATDTVGGSGLAAVPARSGRSVRAARSGEPSLDATCAWGRLADGKGKLLRCLTRDEATALRDAARPSAPAALPGSPAAVGTASAAVSAPGLRASPVGSWPLPAVPAPAAVAVAVAAPAPVAPPAAAVAVAPDPTPVDPEPSAAPAESAFLAEVGPVVADEGALPEALKNLKKPKDRYAECVDRNGGLTADKGEVELRFLVQGKGRAEGVSVKKRRGVGEAAAKCVADVVDRRYVGYPEAPAVGASVVVSITKKKR